MKNSLLLLSFLLLIECSTEERSAGSNGRNSSMISGTDSTTIKAEKNQIIADQSNEGVCAKLIKHAILNKDSLRLQNLLDSGCNVNSIQRDSDNQPRYTALNWATQSRSINLVKFLLKNGADPNIHLYRSPFPIQLASISDYPEEIFYELIKYDVDVNVRNGWIYCATPLACAIESGSMDRARKLIELGAVLYSDTSNFNEPPLYTAAFHGKWDFFKMLLQEGANPNDKFSLGSEDCWPCPDGITILHTVCQEKDDSIVIKIIKELTSFGLDINIENNDGYNKDYHE